MGQRYAGSVLKRQLTCLIKLQGSHVVGQLDETSSCLPVAIAGAETEPHVRLAKIPGHAEAFDITDSQVELGNGIPLFSSHPVPLNRRTMILFDANPLAIHAAQVHLCPGVAVQSSQRVPLRSLREVMRNTDALGRNERLVCIVPCATASRYHFSASESFCSTPSPCW
jgi:hypothetical protein